jgi:hypothetical protein
MKVFKDLILSQKGKKDRNHIGSGGCYFPWIRGQVILVSFFERSGLKCMDKGQSTICLGILTITGQVNIGPPLFPLTLNIIGSSVDPSSWSSHGNTCTLLCTSYVVHRLHQLHFALQIGPYIVKLSLDLSGSFSKPALCRSPIPVSSTQMTAGISRRIDVLGTCRSRKCEAESGSQAVRQSGSQAVRQSGQKSGRQLIFNLGMTLANSRSLS